MVRDADSKLLVYGKDVYAHRHRSLNMTAQSSDEIQRKVEIQTMRTDYRLDARLETRYFQACEAFSVTSPKDVNGH